MHVKYHWQCITASGNASVHAPRATVTVSDRVSLSGAVPAQAEFHWKRLPLALAVPGTAREWYRSTCI